MPSTSSSRLDYLDAVRAFALLLGIAFHASLSFTPVYFGWAVMDISTSPIVSTFMLISHSFRMPLFFLIAGFFTHMSLQKGGISSLFKSRLLRIGLPLIVGWIILRPLLVSGWVMGADSLRADVDIAKGLIAGVTSLNQLPAGFLTGSHLWFLYYLLLFTLAALLLRTMTTRLEPYFNSAKFRTTANISAIFGSRFAISLLTIPTVVCLWFMSHWGIDTPDKSLVPHLPVTGLYGGIFFFGWRLYSQSSAIEKFSTITGEKVFTCIISILACLVLSGYETQIGHNYYNWIKASFLLSYASMMWSLVALCIGLFKVIFNKANRLTRYLADASYWLYLVHLPIVVWLQVAVAELPWHWGVKWSLVTMTAIGISILIYDVAVRPTIIGKVLNGRTMPSVILGKKQISENELYATR